MRSETEIRSEGLALLSRVKTLGSKNVTACKKYRERAVALAWVLGKGNTLLLTEKQEEFLGCLY